MLTISSFAKACETTIKTLRYYYNEGIFKPSSIDRYTGYRYYEENQVKDFLLISELKKLNFSLGEIKNFLTNPNNDIIKSKINELNSSIEKTKKQIQTLNSFNNKSKGNLKMKESIKENLFVNDEKIIGKWESIGVVYKKEDFLNSNNQAFEIDEVDNNYSVKELYLMPNGEKYWVISWTKGFINVLGRKNAYELVEKDNQVFMLVTHLVEKENFIQIFKQIDKKAYTKNDIAIVDDINFEIIKDETAAGEWNVIDFVRQKEDFIYGQKQFKAKPYLEKLVFLKDNQIIMQVDGNIVKKQKYTKGCILINQDYDVASHYFIKDIDGKQIMFFEWKSGDYTFGKRKPLYYVLEKA
ncbi:MAG: MerR family transcriptional regulator [Spirochaetales bacterium]